ncbi:MAG TPA: GMC family oxidoreductase [Microlunatus sp.]|nr:GMC family oxidoreductase [Microlunatus sp.]
MIFPVGATTRVAHATAADIVYDAVIVGGGISGSIVADTLSSAGHHVLVLEGGLGEDHTLQGYEGYLEQFYATAAKDNQSPYPVNPNSPMPRGSDVRRIWPGQPDTGGYLVQNGPMATDTTYTRVLGGTSMHWEAKVPRMLPEDFDVHSRYGIGRDWPISYDDLMPYYVRAEREFGVSADVRTQEFLDVHFEPGYVYPMQELPLSYLDQQVAAGLDGGFVELGGERYPLKVRAFPQARNGIPNPAYDGGKGYRPIGAISTSQVEQGQRCQGNNNCVPICPVQSKYHSIKTLSKALERGNVDLLTQTVASKVLIESATGQVSGIQVQHYSDPGSPRHRTWTMRGRVYVLACSAIENARLMLASGLPSSCGLVGRNLMDHAYLLNWALLPEIAGTYRGTNCTGGIVDLRGGSFRRNQAAFAVDIHNDGWGWATGAPYTDLVSMVEDENLFGKALRTALPDRLSRQLLLAFMIDVPPSPSNRVTVDPGYTDVLGNMRPVISYAVPEYTMRGVQYARQFARHLFQRLGAADHTFYDPADPAFVTHEGEGYVIRGGNHLAGTHIMGTSAADSVVDVDQRSWDHENLYLCGGGSMPSVATSNVTLTLAALCLRSGDKIAKRLRHEPPPA